MRNFDRTLGEIPKSILKMAVLGILVLQGLLLRSLASENLVRNPLYDAAGDDFPAEWRPQVPSQGSFASRVAHPSQPNAYCLEIKTADKGEGGVYVRQNEIAIKPGQLYLFSWHVQAPEGQAYRVYIESIPEGAFGGEWQTGNGKMQYQEQMFTFPSLGKMPYLILQIKTPGKALFGRMSITEMQEMGASGKNLVVNPDFLVDSNEDGMADFWIRRSDSAIRRIKHPEKADAFCLEISDNGEDDWGPCCIQRDLPIKEGVSYDLKLRVKGTTDTQWRGYLGLFQSGEGYGVDWKRGDDTWQTVTIPFTFKKLEKTRPYLVLQIKGEGKILVESVSIQEADK